MMNYMLKTFKHRLISIAGFSFQVYCDHEGGLTSFRSEMEMITEKVHKDTKIVRSAAVRAVHHIGHHLRYCFIRIS